MDPSRAREIALAFLKFGVTAYGGLAAIWGVIQADLQEQRGWLSKERFLEGLALINMLPGAVAVQLCIFVGHARAGWWGGLLAGLCFVLPAFLIMMVLTLGYAAYGATPVISGALYGLGPVVVAIFLAATWRLARTAAATPMQLVILITAAVAAACSPLGTASIFLLAGALGVALFHSRAWGVLVLALVAAGVALIPAPARTPAIDAAGGGLLDIGAFFFSVGALSFGGGLSMIAFIQDQVVNQYHWLTQREFIDGLALGQLTPGPILMVSAYVGYKLAGIAGAMVATAAIFLPAFILMLGILPVFERVRRLSWMKAAVRGIGPAVMGVLLVTLAQMAPSAVPDPMAGVIFVVAATAMLGWKIGPLKVMLAGALLGTLRDRIGALAAR